MADPVMRIAGEGARPLPRKINFTVAALEKLACPAGKERVWVYDSHMRGLAIRLSSKGGKVFYYYRGKVLGRSTPLRMKIGPFPDLSIEQARRKAAEHAGEVARGKDPMAERSAIKASDTLRVAFDRWKAKHGLRKRTLETDESRFDTCFDDWEHRKIGSIKLADVQAKHAELGASNGHVTANRAIQLLRRVLNFARIEPNPAANPKKNSMWFKERQRDRFVQPAELPALFKSLSEEPNETIRDCLHMALYTGARRSNVQSMAWVELDLQRGIWTIPAEKTKAGESIHIPLVTPALEILNRRKKAQDDARAQAIEKGEQQPTDPPVAYAFPGHGRTGHLVEPKAAWKNILQRAGIKNLTLHDLRRTLGSWQAATGASLPVIGKALGHHDPKATAIYARLQLDPVRAAVEKATSAMLAAAEPKTPKPKKEKKGKAKRKSQGSNQDGQT